MARPSPRLPPVVFVAAMAALAAGAAAQSLNELRESLRRTLGESGYTVFLSAMSDFAEDGELSGGRVVIDGRPSTALTRFSLPWREDYFTTADGHALHLEATLGYASTRDDIDDIWSGLLPQTRVTSRTSSYGVDFAFGPTLALGDVGVLQPLAHLGLSYLENRALYAGPGAAGTAALLDGILFNWEGVYGSYGGSLALRRPDTRLGAVRISPLLRYDLRRTEGLAVDDPALDAGDTTHWATLRFDFEGPTGVDLGTRELRWQADLGYRYMFGRTQDVLDFDDIWEVGCGLSWDPEDVVPLFHGLQLGATIHFAEDLFGWSVGLTLRF